MTTRLRVVIVEDRQADAELMLHELSRSGFEANWQRVETEPDYLTHLSPDVDLILADYTLPQFSALRALRLAQERGLDIAFIVVTGSISEEVAVECMKEGAADYLLKDRLTRLGPAVTRALEQKGLRDTRRDAEERIRHQLERLAALRDIDMAITSSLDLRVTLGVFLDRTIAQLRVDAAALLLLDAHSQRLEYAAGRGFRTAALQHTHLRLGEGHAGRAALERQVISIPNLAEAPGSFPGAPLLAEEGFTAYYAVPLIAKGQVKGVLEVFHRTPLDPDQEWLDFFQALAAQAAIAIDNAGLFDDLQRVNADLMLAYDTTLEGWSHALDLRDKETEGHTQRVTELTVRLARAMGASDDELVHIRRGALLHDIGKMGIPDHILLKPGSLTEEEWEVMRKHPVYAYELLSPIGYLRPALDIPYCHHERWDGTGYPRGLKDEQIPLAACIFAIVDVWDALRSDRPYRPAWTEEQALAHIRGQAGKHFDPRVVEVFLESVTRERHGQGG